MGLLGKFFNKEVDNAQKSVIINLSKSKDNLDKVLVNLSKEGKVNLSKHIAKVALAMDYSGSMDKLFCSGAIQRTITRLLPIALRFDDNGELESWLFSNEKKKLKSVTTNNYEDYVKNIMVKSGMCMGGTEYAPVLRDIVKYYNKTSLNDIPAFIIFITDGANSDQSETDKIIRELSEYNMFVQFVGIGNESFTYLRSLDNMPGRKCDNTGFISVKDMENMNDEELYTELIRQYKDWLDNK
ncbi:hypothetical protein C823_007782 [Eubacterium plexicaudatum ASF492]|uniref:VWFA domain-containing protein n=1 Tax=Eubacterium plexicaudatum ASF492 TaxID=1235802 RepID=N2A3T9_9FIRM|nr:hypothetical protein C823_007782 [Eubacterium plexicaudatum ASF492]